jgi:hypothetical protein
MLAALSPGAGQGVVQPVVKFKRCGCGGIEILEIVKAHATSDDEYALVAQAS